LPRPSNASPPVGLQPNLLGRQGDRVGEGLLPGTGGADHVEEGSRSVVPNHPLEQARVAGGDAPDHLAEIAALEREADNAPGDEGIVPVAQGQRVAVTLERGGERQAAAEKCRRVGADDPAPSQLVDLARGLPPLCQVPGLDPGLREAAEDAVDALRRVPALLQPALQVDHVPAARAANALRRAAKDDTHAVPALSRGGVVRLTLGRVE
jgi:hypothetical protein